MNTSSIIVFCRMSGSGALYLRRFALVATRTNRSSSSVRYSGQGRLRKSRNMWLAILIAISLLALLVIPPWLWLAAVLGVMLPLIIAVVIGVAIRAVVGWPQLSFFAVVMDIGLLLALCMCWVAFVGIERLTTCSSQIEGLRTKLAKEENSERPPQVYRFEWMGSRTVRHISPGKLDATAPIHYRNARRAKLWREPEPPIIELSISPTTNDAWQANCPYVVRVDKERLSMAGHARRHAYVEGRGICLDNGSLEAMLDLRLQYISGRTSDDVEYVYARLVDHPPGPRSEMAVIAKRSGIFVLLATHLPRVCTIGGIIPDSGGTLGVIMPSPLNLALALAAKAATDRQ